MARNPLLTLILCLSCAVVAVAGGEPAPGRRAAVRNAGGAAPAESAVRTWADAAWARVMTRFYSPKTGCIYICPPDRVSPARDFPGGLLKPELGYGRGLEDCAIIGGVALSGLVDRYAVEPSGAVRADAAKVARGLMNLASAHPYRGFVARGLCVEDGTSICRLSSRDQLTHWAHGLYRYVAGGLAGDSEKAEVTALFVSVSERLQRTVTKENNWNFLQADGTMDPRGICKMREVYPHEAARLAMVYALTARLSGDPRWEKAYRDLRGEALAESCRLASMPDSLIRGLMPDYALIQMNTSLEGILMVEEEPTARADAIRAMVMCANLARERAPKVASADTKYLCGCAELPLAQLMVPPGVIDWSPDQRAILARAIVAQPVERVGACRAAELVAAYWRAKRLGYSF